MTRYLALDAFRGITIALMILVNTPGTWGHVYAPLLHADWHGATPTDLVFPFFLFIIGSAMFFSFKKSDFTANSEQFLKILKRGFIMFFIGFMLNVIPFDTPLEDLRIMGVLQRIGIAYVIAASLVLLLNRRGIFIFSGVILLAYWGLLVSVGEAGLTLEGNIIRQFDLAILGANHMYTMRDVSFDPEGLLSTIPAVVNMWLGFELTRYLTSIKEKKSSVIKLIIIGSLAIGLGALWHLVLPINKPLWTSSYVIYTTGFACLLLAIFIWLIDIKGHEKLVSPLLVYGTNPLFVYVLSFVFVTTYLIIPVGDSSLYRWLYEQYKLFAEPTLASFLFALSHVILFWFVSLKLYQHKIFIKI
ncbi:heparan-alpha-glucosaminide N-acetyltransferase domain-containing protein [Colwellia sp. 6_MG-2023]|uniref:acyltransferase family protein n=1 Tax=Colwellia sp. 6_MG-2023 TaxID=3062676 RepID=UPI0026E44C30|nr:heparan-alpha-glucosaminide N-acetyltransferase domain-containing protein [Colwellia sp. 6_MG-2023]MDO6487878.1 heparan-alpha-glucosaminide N-acetyltransferase domain-containing protein [Colwellia sp. 6_MG-2023]